ncbi:deoxyribose-phosphate aldolase, partial [Gymnopus androsaceus JB14]
MERTEKEWQAAIGLKISEVLQDTAVPSTIFASITRPTDKLFPSTVDHTMLKPDATSAQIDQLCDEAIRYGFKSCCVNGVHVKQVSARLLGSSTIPCAVIGFPLGASTTAVKVFEAQDAVSCGAQEIDMVIDIGALKSQSYLALFTDIRAVVQGSFPIPVKVILETVFLSDEEKIAGAFVAAEAGAAFVKTCTGFMGGGATKEDVELLWKTVKYREGDVKVKASAAVRSFDKCVE